MGFINPCKPQLPSTQIFSTKEILFTKLEAVLDSIYRNMFTFLHLLAHYIIKMDNSFLLVTALFIGVVTSDNVGWQKSFTENSEEFHDLHLEWEKGENTMVPAWLSGIFVRNGPGQV